MEEGMQITSSLQKSQGITPDVMKSLRIKSTSPKSVHISGPTLKPHPVPHAAASHCPWQTPQLIVAACLTKSEKLSQNTLQHLHVEQVSTHRAGSAEELARYPFQRRTLHHPYRRSVSRCYDRLHNVPWISRSSGPEVYHLLACDDVPSRHVPTFRRNLFPP